MSAADDDELTRVFYEVTRGSDPGRLGDDEPQVRPLCRRCVRDLLADAGGLCEFCKVVLP